MPPSRPLLAWGFVVKPQRGYVGLYVGRYVTESGWSSLSNKDEEVRRMDRVNALSRVEDELHRLRGARGAEVVAGWSKDCPALADAAVTAPAEVPAWVWRLERSEADRVLRVLVELAQAGDEAAVLTVLACLRPGLCALAGRIGVPVDEVVSEATFVVFEFPFARRRTVAGQLLLDTRKRLSRARERVRDVPVGDTRSGFEAPVSGDLGVVLPAVERLSQLVYLAWREGHLTKDAARLVIETRVWGVSVERAAVRLGISRRAAFDRRARAEARLGEVLR